MTDLMTRPVEPGVEAASPDRRRRAQFLPIALTSAPAVVTASWLAHRAADRPMTMDESFTVLTVTGSWSSFVRGVSLDPGMAAYYGLLRVWTLVAGTSLERLRLFSLVAFAVAAVGIAVITVPRRRAGLGLLASVAAALTPMVREATIDARAAGLGAAAAVWLLVAFDRWFQPARPSGRAVRLLTVASLVAAFVHPSTLFLGIAGLGLVWRRTRRSASATDRRLVVGAGGLLVVGLAVATMQSSAADVVASGSFGGIPTVLAQLPGGRALAGLALLLTGTILLAGLAYDQERVIRWFGGAALCWFAACLFVLPLRNLFVPRYFVAAAVLVLVAVVTANLETWTLGLIGTIVAISVLGSVQRLDTDYGYGSTWCALSADLVAGSQPGDRVVLAHTVYASPVVACLGDDAAAYFASVDAVPSMADGLLEDPRAMWQGPAIGGDALTRISIGERLTIVWTPGADPAADEAVAQLPVRGVDCERHDHGALSIAFCAAD